MRSQPRTSDRYNSKTNRAASSYTNTIKSETVYGNVSSQVQTNGPETKDNGGTFYGPVFLNPQDGCVTHVSSYDLWMTAADGRQYCLDVCGNVIYKDGIYGGAERTIDTSQTALSNTIFVPSSSTQTDGTSSGTGEGGSSVDLAPLWDQINKNTQATTDNATIANEAKTASTTAVTTANGAKTTADAAQTTANTGVSKADAAQTTANTAESKADAAQTTANTAESKADAAQTTADTAENKADAAQTTADTAEGKAQTAQATANTAETKADGAQTTANTAVTKADGAQSAADNAQTTANTAGSTAEIAQTAASEAKTEAAAAKSTADNAQTDANTAASKADSAQKSADDAQTTANTAVTKADAAQTTSNNANSASTKNAEEILRIEIGGTTFVNFRWTMQSADIDIRKIAGLIYVDGESLSMQNNNITPFALYPPFYNTSGSEITTVTCNRKDTNNNNTQTTVDLSKCHLQFGIIYGNTYVVTIVTPTDTSATYSFPNGSSQEIQVKRESLVNIYSDIHELANEVGALKTTVDGIPTNTSTPGIDGNVVVNSGYAVEYKSGYAAPTTTTDKLYPKDGIMYYNGSPIFNTSIVMDLSASIDDIVGEITTIETDTSGTGNMSLQPYDVYQFTMQGGTAQTGAIAGLYTLNGSQSSTTVTLSPPFSNSSGAVITTMSGGIKLDGTPATINLSEPVVMSTSSNGDTLIVTAKDTNGNTATFAKSSSVTLINRGTEVVYFYNKNVTNIAPSVQANRNLIVANNPFSLLSSPSIQQQSIVTENETLRSRVESLEATVISLQEALVSSGVIKK
jgi:hypothetical protein